MTILNKHNFDASGRCLIATLTLEQCLCLYHDYFNDWLTLKAFSDYYHLTPREADFILKVGKKLEAFIQIQTHKGGEA